VNVDCRSCTVLRRVSCALPRQDIHIPYVALPFPNIELDELEDDVSSSNPQRKRNKRYTDVADAHSIELKSFQEHAGEACSTGVTSSTST
jgi:hypothetical protein